MANILVAVDTETYPDGTPFCISFTDKKLMTIYYRWEKDEGPQKTVKKILESKRYTKIYHNASFDIRAMQKVGVQTKGMIHDTLLMAKIGLPDQNRYGLKELMQDEELPFNEPCKEYDKVQAHFKKDKLSYDQMPRKLMKKYNKLDTVYTMKLFYYLKTVTKDPIYLLERDLIRTVVDMENNGIMVDIAFTKVKLEWYEERLEQIGEHFRRRFKVDNLASPKQVSALLYDRFRLPPPVWKGKEHMSTDALALLMLKEQFPDMSFLKKILLHRQVATKVKMFLKPFIEKSVNGVVYPSFNQMGGIDKRRIKTGRFSSSNPNFQNIPRGDDIRELIVPRQGHYFLDLDYSQVEMRLYAFFAKDEMMMQAYKEGKDIHVIHKEQMVDPYRKDDGQNRQIAKNIGFEIIYGIGAPGMTNFLRRMEVFLDEDIVRKMLDKWHSQHPALTDLKRRLYRMLRGQGFIIDEYGRRYYLPLAKSYIAVNYYIQGMSANIIKDVMPKVNRYVKAIGGRTLLTIHDELMLELPNRYVESREEEDIKAIMEEPGKWIGVPLEVEYQRLMKSWGDKA